MRPDLTMVSKDFQIGPVCFELGSEKLYMNLPNTSTRSNEKTTYDMPIACDRSALHICKTEQVGSPVSIFDRLWRLYREPKSGLSLAI
jgi:hypothetical protein